MSKSTVSTFEIFAMFPDQEAARAYLEGQLWPNGPTCPVCGLGERITARRKGGFFRCNQCQEDFTVRTGTIFERSHIPLHKWLHAIYLLLTARKGISSLQLSKEIGIRQGSAWFMLHRIREACGGDMTKLQAEPWRMPISFERCRTSKSDRPCTPTSIFAYTRMGGLFFKHDTINHSNGEYVRDGVTTNSIEYLSVPNK
jgi:transposase-like protein